MPKEIQPGESVLTLSNEYVAGLFDGEGCIIISQHKTGYRARAILSNNNTEILRLIHIKYGGYIKRSGLTYQLIFDSIRAKLFLAEVYPFLIIKRRQAELALTFLKSMKSSNNKPLSVTEQEERQWFKDEISRLNQLGGRADIELNPDS